MPIIELPIAGQGKFEARERLTPNDNDAPTNPSIILPLVNPVAMRCPQTVFRDRHSPGNPLTAARSIAIMIRLRGISKPVYVDETNISIYN
ncbi:MAG: hypothetical protein K9M75_04695 [Phycisphaerae bacterium]|nr:hypothetical protein [Phycisphaerae bacterium]